MLILPANSPIYQQLERVALNHRLAIFAGLPGVGKSLWLQQLALMAHQRGRKIHSLQWDVTRAAFETPEILARYPEIDGVTHAGIRKGVGLWARQAIVDWHRAYDDPAHLLIGEATFIGNRLVELAQRRDDEAEPLLTDAHATFLLPVPSKQVRGVIETKRANSIADPQHEREAADAPPNVLQMLWEEGAALYRHWQTGESIQPRSMPYDPTVYAGIYQRLLAHRHVTLMPINELFPIADSVYELGDIFVSELMATPAEVTGVMAEIEAVYTPESLEQAVAQWRHL